MKEIYGKKVYDSLDEVVKPDHTAVILIEMQNDFCSPGGHFSKHGKDISVYDTVLSNLITLVDSARNAGALVVFIQSTTLVQYRSDSPSWLRFKTKAFDDPEYTMDGSWGQDFCKGLEPQSGEPVIKKHRSSAFVATNLDLVLRCNGIESIIVTGCTTHGCVFATAMHGTYNDYYVVVPNDCVGSIRRDFHEAALNIMGTHCDVVSYHEIVQSWRSQ